MWENPSQPTRRSISVASVALSRKLEHDLRFGTSTFDAKPWNQDEYLSAIQDHDFFANVELNLRKDGDTCLGAECTAAKRDELVLKKLYVAGNSARWMWAMDWNAAIKDIDNYLGKMGNAVDFLRGIVGEKSILSVNHLMCKYDGGPRGGKFFVSKYVARQVLNEGGRTAVGLAYGLAAGLDNPSFTGWVVEYDFLLQVRERKGSMFEWVGDTEQWSVNDIISECDESLVSSELLRDGCWYFPKKWNQEGYDAICISVVGTLQTAAAGSSSGIEAAERAGSGGAVRDHAGSDVKVTEQKPTIIIRFVQVTNSTTHVVNLFHFEKFARLLTNELKCEVQGIDIIMATPEDIEFSRTSSMIKSSGRLDQHNVGDSDTKWPYTREFEQVKVKKFKKASKIQRMKWYHKE